MPWSTLEIWLHMENNHSLNAEAWCNAASSKSGTMMLGSAATMEPCYARHPLEIRKSNWMHQNILMEVHVHHVHVFWDILMFHAPFLSKFPVSSFPWFSWHFRNRILLHQHYTGCAAQMVWPEGTAVETWDAWWYLVNLSTAFLEHFWKILSW